MNVLAEGFLESWRLSPASVALEINGVAYTYDELAALASRIADQIKTLPTQKRIGIINNNDFHTYASLLAVTCNGASYVPLNPSYPLARLSAMANAAAIEVVVGKGLHLGDTFRMLDPAGSSPASRDLKAARQQEEAYVLFTSGSSGTPKGVPVSHKNLAAFFSHMDRHHTITGQDRVLQAFELSFDVSVFCVFSAWRNGACLVVPPSEGFRAIGILATLRDASVTVASIVPTVLSVNEKYLAGLKFPRLRTTFFAGERLSRRFAARWKEVAPGSRIYNCYGPTEATIFAATYEYVEPDCKHHGTDVPIGQPLNGLDVLLVDSELRPVEDEGELMLAGDQVVDRYLDGEQEKSFVRILDKKYYRTGDLVRFDKTGDLHFLGRKDQQVKIGGHRIELGEIEQALLSCGFQQAAVLVIGGEGSGKLIAFAKGNVPDVFEKLSRLLPAFMIPFQIVPVVQLPLGDHGKLDVLKLVELYDGRKSAV